MQGTISIEEKKLTREKTAKPLLWIAMVSMSMLFAGLTSAYMVRQGKGQWLQFDLPQVFYFSTAIIMLSSVTMNWVLSSAKKNNYNGVRLASVITLLLGLAFIFCQIKAWGVLHDAKIFYTGKNSNPSGSFLYMLTFLHLMHLVAGIIALSVVWINSILKKYNSENLLGIKLCAIFWHFLDVLWIYLFLFLLFVR
jgi:cytochrome c oxidase subunit 3